MNKTELLAAIDQKLSATKAKIADGWDTQMNADRASALRELRAIAEQLDDPPAGDLSATTTDTLLDGLTLLLTRARQLVEELGRREQERAKP